MKKEKNDTLVDGLVPDTQNAEVQTPPDPDNKELPQLLNEDGNKSRLIEIDDEGSDISDQIDNFLTPDETLPFEALKENPESNFVLFEVNGFQLRANTIYQIIGKEDEDAPEAYIKMGVSKEPDESVMDGYTMAYDNAMNVYDTGFFLQSPCYRGKPKDWVEAQVAARCKWVKDPYEGIVGEKQLDQRNNKFWDGYFAVTRMGKLYSTSDAQQLFDLYLLIQSKHVVPKSREGDPKYKSAMYCIEDKNDVIDVKTKRIESEMEASRRFSELKEKDPKRLQDILLWLDIPSKGIEDGTLSRIFYEYLKRSTNNAEAFVQQYRESANSKWLHILQIHTMLYVLRERNRLERADQSWIVGGYEIDTNLKRAAVDLATKHDFAAARIQVISIYDSLKK
jgi:hypothetical protein